MSSIPRYLLILLTFNRNIWKQKNINIEVISISQCSLRSPVFQVRIDFKRRRNVRLLRVPHLPMCFRRSGFVLRKYEQKFFSRVKVEPNVMNLFIHGNLYQSDKRTADVIAMPSSRVYAILGKTSATSQFLWLSHYSFT